MKNKYKDSARLDVLVQYYDLKFKLELAKCEAYRECERFDLWEQSHFKLEVFRIRLNWLMTARTNSLFNKKAA